MRPHEANGNGAISGEVMARDTLLRMTPIKWRLAALFEALARFSKPLLSPLPPVGDLAEPPARILVVEFWNLGDLAMLVPFLRSLRHSFPGARISLLLNT